MNQQAAPIHTEQKTRVRWFGPIVILFLLVCGLSYILLGTNTYRWQYDQALAKWRSQNIEEYEMVVDNRSIYWYGIWTLRVSNNRVELLKAEDGHGHPRSIYLPSGSDGGSLRYLTVEGEFFLLDESLKHYQFDPEEFCWVTYDSELGYPSYTECHPKPWVSRTDSDTSMRVKSLKILKRGTPITFVTPTAELH